MWFRPEWADALTGTLTELGPVAQMLASAGRGLAFSPETAAQVRATLISLPGLEPAARLLEFLGVLRVLAQSSALPLAGPHLGAAAHPNDARMGRVLEYIHRHYHETVSVADLAALARLSPSGFQRLFLRYTRLTLTAYIAQLRVGQACALLVNTEKPAAHIADAAGYASLANFNRQFRTLKEMTPREFRNRFRR